MAFDTFLDIPGIEGESTDSKFAKKMEIHSFSFGASNPSTVNSAKGGLSAGKVSLSSFNFMKNLDKASSVLFLACASGQHYDKATVSLRKAGGTDAGQGAYLVYEMEHVMVESIQWSGSTGGDDTPTESVSLNYGQIKVTYSTADAKGKLTATTPVGWDQITNKKI